MGNKKKNIGKLISLFLVVLIFYFLGRKLFLNWQQIKEYQFSLDYFNLAISFVFLLVGVLARGLVWRKIVYFLQQYNDLGYLEAMRIESYAQLGRYLPGKVFGPIAKAYLARNKKISKDNLYFSVVLDAILHPIAALLLSLFLIFFFFNTRQMINFPNFYLAAFGVVILGLVITYPKIFRYLVNFFIVKIKKEPFNFNINLSWLNRIKIMFYYSLTEILTGIGFFYLINSLVYLPFQNLLPIIGIFVLAGIFGFLVPFAPGGLGVKEGTLVFFLQVFFPLNIAILIALISRIWTIIIDASLPVCFYFLDKFKKTSPLKEENFADKYLGKSIVVQGLIKFFFNSIKKTLKEIKVNKILEVGCGPGFSTQYLAKILKDKDFQASEFRQDLVGEARKRNPGLKIEQESIYELKRENSSFDLIIALEVLEHLENPEMAVKELARVTSRYCLVSCPNEPLWRILNVLRLKYLKSFGNTPGHLHRWSKEKFTELLEKYFEIKKVVAPLPWIIVL